MSRKKTIPPRFSKKELLGLQYGVIHSLHGFTDGVSIVMNQIEGVMHSELKIPLGSIHYLVGKAKKRHNRVTQKKILWHGHKTNKLMLKHFSEGYGSWYNEVIEQAITEAKKEIAAFIEKHTLDVIIVHNASHPENFISSVALSRYYRDAELRGKKTPKYILWWHDSHLERPRFSKPAIDVQRYLLEGVPGIYVEYIMFINSLQFADSKKYFEQLDHLSPDLYERMNKNHDVMYNTTNTFIESYDDLKADTSGVVDQFLEDYKVLETIQNNGHKLADVLFCLQHTRLVARKRIDFALEYCFELIQKAKKKKKFKSLYFFISGHSAENGIEKRRVKSLYRKLSKKYDLKDVVLVFREDAKSTISFEEFPRIFAKLGGFSTYFSEIEGFGNNLLEVLASGLIPVVYTYPVFRKDIAKFKFKVINLHDFKICEEDLDETLKTVCSQRRRKIWVNRNLDILRRKFPHKIIGPKLRRAIIRRRTHF